MDFWDWAFLILLGFFFFGDAKAQTIADIDQVSFEAYKVGTFRDANFDSPESKNTKGVAWLIDLSVLEYVKWKNKVWSHGNDSKLYTVGWEYDISVSLHENLEVFHYHHSQHSMDEPSRASRFPLRNYYGLRLNFLGGGR